MAETQPDSTSSEKVETGIRSAIASGMDVGDFTRTQGLLKSLRLMLNNQIVVPVEEIVSGLNEAGRKYKMGEIEQANQEVTRLYAVFGRKISQWEGQARNLEQQMRMQAAKNPKSISIDTMNRMKSEQTAVRTRIRSTEVQFRRLHQALDSIFSNLPKPAEAMVDEASVGSPADVMTRFKDATDADRPQVVRDYFDVETVLTVKVSRGTKGGHEVKFDPMPPLSRLYFLTKTAQLIRLQQLSNVVLIEDLETGQNSELRLAEFVKHVQEGAWLLKERS